MSAKTILHNLGAIVAFASYAANAYVLRVPTLAAESFQAPGSSGRFLTSSCAVNNTPPLHARTACAYSTKSAVGEYTRIVHVKMILCRPRYVLEVVHIYWYVVYDDDT